MIDQGTTINISLSSVENERYGENALQPLVMLPVDSLNKEHG